MKSSLKKDLTRDEDGELTRKHVECLEQQYIKHEFNCKSKFHHNEPRFKNKLKHLLAGKDIHPKQ